MSNIFIQLERIIYADSMAIVIHFVSDIVYMWSVEMTQCYDDFMCFIPFKDNVLAVYSPDDITILLH